MQEFFWLQRRSILNIVPAVSDMYDYFLAPEARKSRRVTMELTAVGMCFNLQQHDKLLTQVSPHSPTVKVEKFQAPLGLCSTFERSSPDLCTRQSKVMKRCFASQGGSVRPRTRCGRHRCKQQRPTTG